MSKKLLCLMLFLQLLFLVACSEREKKVPLEDVGMVGIIAFDYIDKDSMKLTVAIPQYSPEAQRSTQTFTVVTDLVSNGIVEIEKLSDKKIVFNQLRVVLFNEEFARQGNVRKVIQHLYRNAEVGNKVLIAIVKEKGEEMLKYNYPDKPNINFYLNDLLQPSINTAFNPNTNIHDFMYTITNPVYDPIIPFVDKNSDKIEIKGIAVFKGNQMFELINPKEALIIQAIQGRKNLAPLDITMEQGHGKEKLLIDLVENDVHIKSNKSMTLPKLTISIEIKGTLSEYKGERENDLFTTESLAELEKDVNKELEQDIKKFLDKLNEWQVDPSGISEYFRMYYYGKWTTEKKREIVSKVAIDVHVKTSIISTGTLK
ncbi:Ger(x)C family spore germination protein [Lysinibacillus sp. FSL W8-0992]|uniref:Ger(x)C family spore germination protein n=1 Tax=Lysinibacillus sp. FSL W8-0992 TaxID=2954643 RepID=UPI0030FC5A7E